ncbi:MAG: DUF6323 family protein [Parafannyhessea sp.]|uniref:DUF6323 family protein n=1 Tax=Parafannyhessea sp. TaxID=2847324 RepID=UPI003F0B944F
MPKVDALSLLRTDGGEETRLVRESLGRRGLALRDEELCELDSIGRERLAELGRVELGPGPLPLIAEAFADSPYLERPRLAEQLSAVQEAFLELRDAVDAAIPDAELAWALREAFDESGGDADALWGVRAEDVLPATDGDDPWGQDPWASLHDARPAEDLL